MRLGSFLLLFCLVLPPSSPRHHLLAALLLLQALCINEAVLRLGSPALINERCLELQRGKTKVRWLVVTETHLTNA